MDGTTFDTLITPLATTPLTRAKALRGLAASAVTALTGMALTREEAGAKQKNRDDKEVRICICASADAATCRSKKKDKSKAKTTLRRNLCAYKGRCTGVSGCAATAPPTTPPPPPQPGFSCTSNAQCARFEACFGTACGPCTRTADCDAGEACVNGRCLAGSGRNSLPCAGENPTGDAECKAFGSVLECFGRAPATTPQTFICALGNDCAPTESPEVCIEAAGEFCVLGECVTACSPTNPCTDSGDICLSDICVD